MSDVEFRFEGPPLRRDLDGDPLAIDNRSRRDRTVRRKTAKVTYDGEEAEKVQLEPPELTQLKRPVCVFDRRLRLTLCASSLDQCELLEELFLELLGRLRSKVKNVRFGEISKDRRADVLRARLPVVDAQADFRRLEDGRTVKNLEELGDLLNVSKSTASRVKDEYPIEKHGNRYVWVLNRDKKKSETR